MKNYLSAPWKAFRGWSSTSWRSGRSGKINVVFAWGLLAVLPVTLLMLSLPDVELELRPGMDKAALLCRDEQVFEEILNAKHPSNDALLERFRHQPEVQGRILVSDGYAQRSLEAVKSEVMNKIAQGHCIEVTNGDPVKIRRANLTAWESADDLDRMWVTYRGRMYRAFAGDWQRASGDAVATQDHAPFRTSPSYHQSAGNRAPVTVINDPAQDRIDVRPVPRFTQGQTYEQVRETLLHDGWQPVISKNADVCQDGDTRCQGRPEMQSCGGTGLAMCRFAWQRDGQLLTICSFGEEVAMFHSICD